MITASGITRTYGRTRARTHLGRMGSMGTLELTCGNAARPTGIIGGINGAPGIIGADLRKRPTQTVKPQVTPNLPNNPTGAPNNPTNNPTVKPQVSSNNPNNPTHFVSTRARAYARGVLPS